MKIINIVIADDEELFRKGIRFLLEKEFNFNIIYEAENGKDLINFIVNTKIVIDVILMDLNMPEINGVEATKVIHKKNPDIKIIALTSYGGKSFITNMIDVGASSYLLKNTSPKMMIFTIDQVYEKGFYYDEKVLNIIHKNIISSSGKRIKSDLDKKLLSKREIDVLELICEQNTTSEIAEKLFISPRTVEGHRNNLLLKTQSKNVAGLVIYGIQKKIIEITPDFNL
ncbi:DNA-binding response regulator [Polaribacter reichenbachii]|uniref:LuxR family transcriptional regulator n=1 Tax=Polaribacter reichenbachii TaxID=996801 RepID=A0A1B8U603_9FLAO|nr:response regulator transcription factor [Polaribacter reichenbachii]APZ45989.1 DNA-binding response regulator [Polaribacter reichenbachii]AUC19851.1 DNA-binding response regulator [Polaribacter reichenbachii]OBY67294.1 LuxR family transcriptional regulator [Polaribacter reichenbachii]